MREDIVAEKFLEQKIKFFKALTNLLAFYHWNHQLLCVAEAQCGWETNYSYLLFPEGLKQIIFELSCWQDQVMIDALKEMPKRGNTKEKIAIAIYERIILNTKINHIKYMSYFASQAHVSLASKLAWQTSDKIWQYAGDQSVDFNYYTKRGLLSGAYSAAALFYASDQSPQNLSTKQFIADSLSFITNLASLKNKLRLPNIINIPFLRLL